jgi:hypothetical protein
MWINEFHSILSKILSRGKWRKHHKDSHNDLPLIELKKIEVRGMRNTML